MYSVMCTPLNRLSRPINVWLTFQFIINECRPEKWMDFTGGDLSAEAATVSCRKCGSDFSWWRWGELTVNSQSIVGGAQPGAVWWAVVGSTSQCSACPNANKIYLKSDHTHLPFTDSMTVWQSTTTTFFPGGTIAHTSTSTSTHTHTHSHVNMQTHRLLSHTGITH